MQFSRLRLSGFKSFVDPTELRVETGLTGIVGPNGCGKSNLVEALRWVMGENSAKSMRGSGMDDVIFAGTDRRPARNLAEVSLLIDNAARRAPAAFNDEEALEVTRRIERESGSAYRINGRDVRARDVQLLFADAATGAHSPALVSQGRVGALITAKPQDRRAILEEAAGISGLHSRRREAEQRLRAAEANLLRLQDVLTQLENQIGNLKKQARQAARYRTISSDIRRAEAALLYLRWKAAVAEAAAFEERLRESESAVAAATAEVARLSGEQAGLAASLQDLRKDEAEAAAALQRLVIARETMEAEEKRRAETLARLEQQLRDIARDEARETEGRSDSHAAHARLEAEKTRLLAAHAARKDGESEASERLQDATRAASAAEERYDRHSQALSEARGRKASLMSDLTAISRRHDQFQRDLLETKRTLATLEAGDESARMLKAVEQAIRDAEARVLSLQENISRSEQASLEARAVRDRARDDLERRDSEKSAIEAERATLVKRLQSAQGGKGRAIAESVTITPGFERALGAALGDGLEASEDSHDPVHWRTLPAYEQTAPLPSGLTPLEAEVSAPPALGRILSGVGVVESDEDALRLAPLLRPGQMMVSRAGALWRWDGLSAAADAPSIATIRLEQRNRLKALDAERATALAAAEAARRLYDEAVAALAAEVAAENALRAERNGVEKILADARRRAAEAAAEASRRESRRLGLIETRDRLAEDAAKADSERQRLHDALAGIADIASLEAQLQGLRSEVEQRRQALADARAAHDGLKREAAARQERLAAIALEADAWTLRIGRAEEQLQALAERKAAAISERDAILEAPDQLDARRNALFEKIGEAERRRQQAADRLSESETRLAAHDKAMRAVQESLSEARESRARAEAGHENAVGRRKDITVDCGERFQCPPPDVLARTGGDAADDLPPSADIETRLERLKAERERLGAVNLRAEEELMSFEEQLEHLLNERRDLETAIHRLRQAIGSLNREGRERLLQAFEAVNRHFTELFRTLFGGGHATLQLVESDDPLEAGLEIMASPPGKKLQMLSLLSGGEQALTALSLIFAVFMTNPAPICVLDEVDAPLDEANVERLCDLLDAMIGRTDTRFLIVTHNEVTMARMHRLFGVTMGERGVSQLVSVDLERAGALVAAE